MLIGVKILKYKRNRVPMSVNSTNLFEEEVRKVIHEMCADMNPSRKTIETIMKYAATCELPS